MGRMKGVDYKSLKEIEHLSAVIHEQERVHADLKAKNDQKSKQRAQVNQKQEDLYQHDRRL